MRLEGDETYLDAGGRVELLPGVADRLRTVEQDLVLVVANQAGLERGTRSYEEVRGWFEQLNAAVDGVIADYWASPHLDSPFRKPLPGMLTAIADKHFIDLGRSLYVGDSADDRACAAAAGVGCFEWAHDFFGWPRPTEGVGRTGRSP